MPQFSDEKTAVWQRSSEVVIAFRGTEIDDARDLADDALIVAGLEGQIDRVDSGSILVQQVQDAYPGKSIALTGHSLGGQIAMQVLMRRSGLNTYVYNPGVTKVEQHPEWERNLYIYHIQGDPISVLAKGINAKEVKTFEKKRGMNSHTISQFTSG